MFDSDPGRVCDPGRASDSDRARDPDRACDSDRAHDPDSAHQPSNASLQVNTVAAPANLQALRGVVPGPATLNDLLALDRSGLTADDALAFLEILQAHLNWLDAIQAEALVAVAGEQPQVVHAIVERPGDDTATAVANGPAADRATNASDRATWSSPVEIEVEDTAREEVACALRWSSGYAQRRIDVARVLTRYLPETLSALAVGRISQAHAAAITDGIERLPGFDAHEPNQRAAFHEAAAQLEAGALAVAARSTVARTRRYVNIAVAALIDLDEDERRRRRRLSHQVCIIDEFDGTATLLARMSAEHAYACLSEIDALANDPRLAAACDATVGERRALALTTLLTNPGCIHSATTDEEQTGADLAPRVRAHLDIVISLESLLALTCQPAQIPGGGPLPATVVRGLLADATMRRLVTDPLTGHVLDCGRRSYRIPDALRRFIEARDQVCRFPGCNRRALNCQIDHATSWNDGGTTAPANLGALCTRHHQLKTHAGWRIQRTDASGACTWRSPLGRTYQHDPQPPLLAPRPALPLQPVVASQPSEPLPDPPPF